MKDSINKRNWHKKLQKELVDEIIIFNTGEREQGMTYLSLDMKRKKGDE